MFYLLLYRHFHNFTDVNEFEAGSDSNGTYIGFWKPHEWRYANKVLDGFNRISQLR